jgi:hypothetical protein
MANKFPSTIGACIDLAYRSRQERLDKEREFNEQIEALKEKEQAIEEHIIATFKKSDIEGAKGSIATAGIIRNTIPSVKDWPKFYAYIKKNDAFDLLERRPARVAYNDRIEAGEDVPGVEPFVKTKLSLTKIGEKKQGNGSKK